MDNPYDGKSGRIPNRLRKRTIAEQWLADPEMTEMRNKRIKNIEVSLWNLIAQVAVLGN